MSATLVGVAGPVKGTVFELHSGDLSIGREKHNTVVIEESAVSRRHCVVQARKNEYHIHDLKSRNGTYVNGMPVQGRRLCNGDQVQVGSCAMLFQDRDAASSSSGILIEEGPIPGVDMTLPGDKAVYLAGNTVAEGQPQSMRLCRDLTVLLKIGGRINFLRGRDELQSELLESIFQVIPAQRGAILLVEKDSEEFACVFARERDGDIKRPVPVSRTVVRQVLREKVGILSNDIKTTGTYSKVRSLADFSISSLLAVPLLFLNRVLGLIYLNTSNAKVRFDEDHLQLLTGIAGIAATALENACHLEALEAENRQLQAEANIEHNMVGDSVLMHDLYQFIGKVSPTSSTVLICGESGTGKSWWLSRYIATAREPGSGF